MGEAKGEEGGEGEDGEGGGGHVCCWPSMLLTTPGSPRLCAHLCKPHAH